VDEYEYWRTDDEFPAPPLEDDPVWWAINVVLWENE
jgi:hypothetical protein